MPSIPFLVHWVQTLCVTLWVYVCRCVYVSESMYMRVCMYLSLCMWECVCMCVYIWMYGCGMWVCVVEMPHRGYCCAMNKGGGRNHKGWPLHAYDITFTPHSCTLYVTHFWPCNMYSTHWNSVCYTLLIPAQCTVYTSNPCIQYVTFSWSLHSSHYTFLIPVLLMLHTPDPCTLYFTQS